MEDLHVHEVQQNMKVSEESSAATLGAMLPTVPPDKEIIKKEGMTGMIPEEVIDFIYCEDAQFTYAVEGAFDNMVHNLSDKFSNSAHGKEVSVNSLPFKVRKLTIERATLRVKIAWMGKRKSKQAKVAIYKKRLVEVEQALRKIKNSVTNADEKAKLEKEINDLDTAVTKEQQAQVQRRALTESVNTMIREGKEAGYILSDMREYTVNEFCPMDDEYGFDVIFTEGANAKLAGAYAKSRTKFSAAMAKARVALAKKDFKKCNKHIKEAKEALDIMSDAINKYPQYGMMTNDIGRTIGNIQSGIEKLLKTLTVVVGAHVLHDKAEQHGKAILTDKEVTTLGTAVANLDLMFGAIKRQANNEIDPRSFGGGTLTQRNGYYNRMLTYLRDAKKVLDKFSNKVYKEMQKKGNAVQKAEAKTKSTAKKVSSAVSIFESSDLEDVLIECTDGDEALMEGANLKLVDVVVDSKMHTRKAIKRAKKALRKGNTAEAADEIKKIKEYVENVEKALKNYPTDSVSTNALGMITGWLIYDITSLIKHLIGNTGATVIGTAGGIATGTAYKSAGAGIMSGVAYTGGVAAISNTVIALTNLVGVLRRFKANLDDKKKKKRDLDFTFVNGMYNRCLVYLKDTGKALDKLEKSLRKAKIEEKKEKETKESVTEEIMESAELNIYTELVSCFESGLMEEESFLDLMLEARKPDDGMMGILSTLHNKGYKTKYSCSGHKDSGKHDRNDDGIVNGKLTSAARIMFGADYDFPDPPKHWGFKTVDGKDYLYVLPYSTDSSDPKAFDAWKNRYISSLKRWVDALPNAKESKSEVVEEPRNEDKKDAEKDVKESVDLTPVDVDAIMEEAYATLMMDTNDFF